MKRYHAASLLLASALAGSLATPAAAQVAVRAAPVADAAEGPAVGRMLPRGTPRTLATREWFDEIDWIETPALDVPTLLAEDDQQGSGPMRMGWVQDVLADSAADGQWIKLDSGGWLWTLKIRAPGAVALRLRIEPWVPPIGAELIVFAPRDPATTARGPFRLGEPSNPERFWTPTIYSSELYLEYYLPPEVDRLAAESQLLVTGLLNQYRDPYATTQRELGCHLDVMCSAPWIDEAAGVGALALVDAPGGFFCSGAMLSRLPGDFARIFMTATHCGVTDANADTVEVTWFWQRASCAGSLPDPALLPMTVGCTVLAQDVTTDWTLVGLTSGVPGGLTWLGWDANAWANGSSATGIHHPGGSWKRISFGTKPGNGGFRPNPQGGQCVSGDAYTVNYPVGNGLTEPGSSGSPIFDSAGRVRGTLSCAFYDCALDNGAYYGRLDQFYTNAEPFLAPADPVYADSAFGGFERGTEPAPFNTAKEAVLAVIAGHSVYFDGGDYPETLTIDRPMTLHAQNGVARIGE